MKQVIRRCLLGQRRMTVPVVAVGAHLDSALEGAHINGNGSGSAAILEIALQLANLHIKPRNQLRFIWLGAKGEGLLGSGCYVSQLNT